MNFLSVITKLNIFFAQPMPPGTQEPVSRRERKSSQKEPIPNHSWCKCNSNDNPGTIGHFTKHNLAITKPANKLVFDDETVGNSWTFSRNHFRCFKIFFSALFRNRQEEQRQQETMDEMFVEFFDAIDDLSDNEMEGTSGMGLGLVIPKLKTDGHLGARSETLKAVMNSWRCQTSAGVSMYPLVI